MIQLGPPDDARCPLATAPQHDFTDVLLAYVANQRLYLCRRFEDGFKYFPPKVYYGREARHVEDRRRPNMFLTLQNVIHRLRADPYDYLYHVSSTLNDEHRIPSPQELSVGRFTRSFVLFQGSAHRRVLMLLQETLDVTKAFARTPQQLRSLDAYQLPPLLELLILDHFKYTVAEPAQLRRMTKLAALEYLSLQPYYAPALDGQLPAFVQKQIDKDRDAILEHGGLT